jgi:hypothetical protein
MIATQKSDADLFQAQASFLFTRDEAASGEARFSR